MSDSIRRSPARVRGARRVATLGLSGVLFACASNAPDDTTSATGGASSAAGSSAGGVNASGGAANAGQNQSSASGGANSGSGGASGQAGTVNAGGSAMAFGGSAAGGMAAASGGVEAEGGVASASGGTSVTATAGSTGNPITRGGSSNAGGSTAIEPPTFDKASTIPVARQSGYTTDANIVYGPLPEQRLDVLYPSSAGPKGTQTLPGVIMFHGGGWIEGDKATMSSFYSRFLAHGFVVCTAEYRVAKQGIAPAAVQDALLAAKWFWDHFDYYHINHDQYVVTGGSAGGHLALMVGMATAEAKLGPSNPADFRIAAIVNGYGPTDVTDMLQRKISFAVQWLPASTPNRDAIAKQVSPVTYVRKDLPPLLTVQGSNDTTVPVAEGQTLDMLLKAAGADAEHHLVAGAGHGFSSPASAWPDAEKTIFDFLTRHHLGK